MREVKHRRLPYNCSRAPVRSAMQHVVAMDEAITRWLAVGVRGGRLGWALDCLLFVPAITFSWPASIFASGNAIAVLVVEPSWPWFLYGVAPSLAFTAAALESERRRGLHNGLLTRAADVVFVPVAALALCFTTEGFNLICFLVASSLLAQRMNQTLKKLLARPRPPREWSEAFRHRGYYFDVRGLTVNEGASRGSSPVDLESLPSGDAAQAGAFAGALSLFKAEAAAWWFVLAAPVAVARCYFGNHWLLDTGAGVLQGYLCALSLSVTLGGAHGHGAPLVTAAVVLYFLSGFVQARFAVGLAGNGSKVASGASRASRASGR